MRARLATGPRTRENPSAMDLFSRFGDAPRLCFWQDATSGLRAVLCLDDLRLGPAAGGIRTRTYPSDLDAVRDARRLARAMTYKCALAGLRAGGAKTVVLDHPGLKREAAFAVLGQRIEELGGLYLAAGDLGTGPTELAAVAAHTSHVRTDEGPLAEAVARGLVRCVRACAEQRGAELEGLRVAIQGSGAIGAAAARALAAEGARLQLTDLHVGRARELAEELGGTVVDPAAILQAECDVLMPCAVGDVLGEAEVRALHAWAVVPGANNAVRDEAAAATLVRREVLHVPDVIASAGAVIEGVTSAIMGSPAVPHFDRLEATAREVLERSLAERRPADAIARELAEARLAAA